MTRPAQAEAATDLARLAGLHPAGVICDILSEDGGTAGAPEVVRLAWKYHLAPIGVKGLIDYRMRRDKLVRRVAETELPTKWGRFRAIVYHSAVDRKRHLVLAMGGWKREEPVMVRLYSECVTGDVSGSLHCDCGPQLHRAMELIAERGKRVLVYMCHGGWGIGLWNEFKVYELQDFDPVQGFKPDLMQSRIEAQVLVNLGLSQVRLLTNDPRKMADLGGYGLKIVARVPLAMEPTQDLVRAIRPKDDKLGYALDLDLGRMCVARP